MRTIWHNNPLSTNQPHHSLSSNVSISITFITCQLIKFGNIHSKWIDLPFESIYHFTNEYWVNWQIQERKKATRMEELKPDSWIWFSVRKFFPGWQNWHPRFERENYSIWHSWKFFCFDSINFDSIQTQTRTHTRTNNIHRVISLNGINGYKHFRYQFSFNYNCF